MQSNTEEQAMLERKGKMECVCGWPASVRRKSVGMSELELGASGKYRPG